MPPRFRSLPPVALWVALLVLAFALAGAAQARPPAPDTPAGRLFDAWLAMFESGDQARADAFRREHGGEAADETVAFRGFTGGLDLRDIAGDGKRAVVATLRARDGAQMDVRVRLAVDPARPQRIATLTVEPQPVPRLPMDDAVAGLRARLDALSAEDAFSGVVLVARGDRTLLREAWGSADRVAAAPMTPATRLRVASVGKLFTAVAALRLVERGRLSLDGTIGDYLPDYPGPAAARAVTVRQLLAHTSGLAEIDFADSPGIASPADWRAKRDALRTHADYVAAYAARPMQFAPGARMAYDNYGFIVLGRILERVTGQDYDALLKTEVFDPAGMTATSDGADAPVAVGYTARDGRWIANDDLLPARATAAGGIATTADDLLAFARALLDGRLLSPAMLAEATRPQNAAGWYGLGFVRVGEGPLFRFGHAGDFPGMNADVRIFPATRTVLIALSNLDPPAGYRPFRWFEPRMPPTSAHAARERPRLAPENETRRKPGFACALNARSP